MRRRLFLGAILLALLGLADACWYEPRRLLLLDSFRLPLNTAPMRIVQLSDLHISEETALLRRLLGQVEAAQPDLILISGDLIRDVPAPGPMRQHLADTAAYVAALRRIAPVIAVQGHSEFQGPVVARLQEAGLRWLSNEGTAIGMGPDGAGRGFLLLGVNQQVGVDDQGWAWRSPFRPVEVDGRRLYGATRGEPYRNFYSHYDPAPAGIASLADTGGPLSWSGYEVTCDARISDEETGVGISLHSRYVAGEDRMIEFSRDESRWGRGGTFALFEHGSALSGRNDTGISPKPGIWYRLKVRTEVEPGRVVARARLWPADRAEPTRWQAEAEDRSPTRVTAGTVGLWASGGGTVVYRNLRVVDRAGRVLLDEPLVLPPGSRAPRGFRVGTRGTRLDMALARSPEVPPGTPVVILSHMADVAREASRRGLPVVLAGHTHGGQVRLPFFGALTTRSSLGAFYDQGRFEFAAPNDRGLTTLYINPGVGMSVMPVRFDCPPQWALVELGR
jgi:predicted MPP superfamily phosphohydrolase